MKRALEVVDEGAVKAIASRLTADLVPFVVDYLAEELRSGAPTYTLPTAVASGLHSAYEAWGADGDATEDRAALMRLAARVVLLLALDEVQRGPRAVARDMNRIDRLGHVRPKRGGRRG